MRVNACLGESQEIAAVRKEYDEEQQHLDELKKRQHTSEWEIDDYNTKIMEIEEKLYSGRIKNPKELANLQHEAEGFKGQRSQVEDRVLEIMEQIAQGEARAASLAGRLEKLEEAWRQEQAQLQAEAAQRKAIIAELQQKRQTQVSDIEPATVGIYQEIKRQKGRAVAKLERGTCRACGITLSTAQLQQAKSKQMLRCRNCGRILVLA
jgi:predicted  nucleic acid-binding Zn-ribbon protein